MLGACALAVLSGAAYAMAFPPWSWTGAAWIALAPLFLACARQTLPGAAFVGLVWAAVVGVLVCGFLPRMVGEFFAVGPAWGGVASALIVAAHAIVIAAFCAWIAGMARRGRANPVVVAGGWLAAEYGRAHLAPGGGWALAAYSQLDWLPIVQFADVAGPYGIGALIAAVNAGLAALCVPGLRGQRPWRCVALVGAGFVAVVGYGQWRIGQVLHDEVGTPIAVVQGGTAPDRVARYVDLTRATASGAARVVVWPEHTTSHYLGDASPEREAILGLSREIDAELILGAPHYAPSPTGTRYHNSAYLVRAGRIAGRYDKQRLVPIAEGERPGWLSGSPSARYTAGDGHRVLATTAWRAGVTICIEAMFPELVRRTVADGADVLLNLANDAWFDSAAAARLQLAIAMLRAIEARRYLVRAASTGVSAVIDPHGHVVAAQPYDAFGVLNATVHASRIVTPYQRLGDAFAWLVMAGVATVTLRLPWRRRRS